MLPSSESERSSAPSAPSSLARAALLGLGLGLLGGALMLVAFALRGMISGPDCTGLLPIECAAETQNLATLGRLQALSGVALALLSLAAFLVLRRSRRPTAHP
jgi:hypothetical protein